MNQQHHAKQDIIKYRSSTDIDTEHEGRTYSEDHHIHNVSYTFSSEYISKQHTVRDERICNMTWSAVWWCAYGHIEKYTLVFFLLCVWCEWDDFMCVDHTVVVLDPVYKRVKRQKGWETRLERLETNRVKQLKTTGCPTRRTFKWSHGSCEAVLSHFNIGFLVLNGFWIFSSEAGFCYWWRFLVKVVFLKYFFFDFFIKTLLCYCCVI